MISVDRYRFSIAIVVILAHARLVSTADLVSKEGCNSTKGCLFVPAGCDPTSPNSCISGVTYRTRGDSIDFELLAKLDSKNGGSAQYAALGFSEDQNMGKDAVTHCIYTPSTGKVTVGLSYNPDKFNELISDKSWVESQIHDVSGNYVSGTLVCRFSQKIKPPSAPGADQKIYPLDKAYNLLIATGTTTGDGSLNIHSTNEGSEFFPKVLPRVSFDTTGNTSNQIAANGGSAVSNQNWKRLLVRSHGILMIFGWWLFVACAILFARYFKTMLGGRKMCGLDYWFHFHRGLNIIGISAVIAGFVCIFVAKDGKWIGVDVPYSRWFPSITHGILGLTASIGGFLQPIMAIFRCDKHAPKRPIFNWLHRFVGLASWGCASAAIWLTTEFMSGMKPVDYYGMAPKGLMIFYWVVLGVVIIGLEIWITLSERIRSRAAVASDIQLRTINGKTVETTVTPANKYGIIRGILLIFFAVVAIGVTVALACFIALPNGA